MPTFRATTALPFSSRSASPDKLPSGGVSPSYPLGGAAPEVHALRRPGLRDGDVGAYAAGTVGESEPMHRLRSQVKRIAPYFRTALITGAAGTGKDSVARMLHALSPCAEGEFMACEASAFAEAMLREEGRAVLDAVQGGTLFLDDVGEVPPALQGTLLRLWSAVGRGKMRVVAGTHRDLRTMSVTGQFRQDLAQRLMGVEIALTPLRDRREDMPAVIGEVLRKVGGDRDLELSGEALARMLEHSWPGDVGEVEKTLWAAARVAEGAALIEARHLPEMRVEESAEAGEMRLEKLQDVVQQHVLGVLTRCAGNKLRAAEVLGISRSTLYRMLDSCIGGDGASEF